MTTLAPTSTSALDHEDTTSNNVAEIAAGEDTASSGDQSNEPAADQSPDQSTSPSGSGGDAETEQTGRSNPVAEARRYRKRAQAAEKILEDLKQDLAAREKTISEHEQTISSLERRKMVDELLLESDVIDLETARLLTEMAVAEMEQPDVELAVSELPQRKPFLFRSQARRGKPGSATGVQSAHSLNDASPRAQALDHAAVEAGVSGKRTDLLRYLRLRRKR